MPTSVTPEWLDDEIGRLERLAKDHPERITPSQRMTLGYFRNARAKAER